MLIVAHHFNYCLHLEPVSPIFALLLEPVSPILGRRGSITMEDPMKNLRKLSTKFMIGLAAALIFSSSAFADHHEEDEIDVNDPNYNPDPTLFKGRCE